MLSRLEDRRRDEARSAGSWKQTADEWTRLGPRPSATSSRTARDSAYGSAHGLSSVRNDSSGVGPVLTASSFSRLAT